MSSQLKIFDTTLRDGEQSPGASMTLEEKMQIAQLLEKMRVDIIEAGFPAASPGDFEAVNAIAKRIKNSVVCGLARAHPGDIERAGEALEPAEQSRIHTFIATSPIHMKEKLRLSPDEVVERAVAAVKQARSYTENVEFSPEDAGRSEPDFLCRILEAVIDAGATTVNIPDTVGYAMPEIFGKLIGELIERVPNSDKAVFSVHCHNDLGLAVSNSLSAVMAGARQVECTINGLGERAGNASLEEVVMAVKTRPDVFDCDTRIDTTQLVPASRLISSVTGFPVQPNKAIVGINAFAHEAGIHQDGVLKNRETYEIMRAEDVGWSANRMVLGKHSGRNAFADHLKSLGVEFASEDQLNDAFMQFKIMADKKHDIYDDDLLSIVSSAATVGRSEKFKLISVAAQVLPDDLSVATVEIQMDGQTKRLESRGNGVVDAVFQAIKNMVGFDGRLMLYSVNSITTGTDAQGEVGVRLEKEGRVVNGHGTDLDIVKASARAYINALNKLFSTEEKAHPQYSEAI
ncbi:MAG: 2-isopropylmalate synthase [Proteobacteria bacterium]|nr:2-isopropylmalate synthase [Pseudomonadota bacterium]